MREEKVGAENRRIGGYYSNPGKSDDGLGAVRLIRTDWFPEIF